MLPLFNSFVASVLVLAFLVWVIALPFFAAWWLLSVRKSLARIADAVESHAPRELPLLPERQEGSWEDYQRHKSRISTSALGR